MRERELGEGSEQVRELGSWILAVEATGSVSSEGAGEVRRHMCKSLQCD